MPKKSFSTSTPDESTNDDPIVFEIFGKDLKGKDIEPIEFTCLPIIQGAVLTSVIEQAERGVEFALAHITNFIRHCLPEEEVARFEETVTSKNIVIEITTLGEIMQWLMEAYGNRPTAASSVSQPGPTETGPTSTDASGSMGDQTLEGYQPVGFATSSTRSSLRIAEG